MDINKAYEVFGILDELGRMNSIKDTLEREDDNYWSLLTPNTRIIDREGLKFPIGFRSKFKSAVEEHINDLEQRLKKL